ncbi:MAG TPA: long-chain fatty acid--CoA ligase [Jiangellaceae bacterium]
MQFPDLTAKRAELNADKSALADVATGREFNYAELDQRASGAAVVFRDAWGVRPGDRVAVLAHNRTDTIELLFACAKLGAVLVPLNWRLSVPELKEIAADADPVGLVYDDPNAEAAGELCKERGLRSMAFGPDPSGAELGYETALGEAGAESIVHPPRDEGELWYLLYTSGTTGTPKGVRQTFGMALVNHLNIGLAVGITGDDAFLSVLPQFHTGGINLYTLPMLLAGGTTLITRLFDPGETLALLSTRANLFFGVPTMFQMLADHPDFATTDLSGVRSWACGGAAMPVPLLERLAARRIQVRQGMGMTETGPTVFLLDEEHAIEKAGSVGKPQPFVEARIVDRSGRDVADGEAGELLLRGAGITPGYWRRPGATSAAFTDGWLHSGDVARRDADGYYYIVDRWKDMYISGGENVYPAEVERVMIAFPGVADVAVVGVPDEQWGEVGKAFVVPSAGADVDPDRLLELCRAELAAFKVPKHVEIVDALPHNASGKVLKDELRTRPAPQD